MYRYELNYLDINNYVKKCIDLASNLIGRQIEQSNGKIVFNSIFGVTPFVCGVTWYLLLKNTELKKDIEQVHLLWALYFLKNYSKEEVLRPIFKNPDKKTIRDKMWFLIEKISCLSSIVVSIFYFFLLFFLYFLLLFILMSLLKTTYLKMCFFSFSMTFSLGSRKIGFP